MPFTTLVKRRKRLLVAGLAILFLALAASAATNRPFPIWPGWAVPGSNQPVRPSGDIPDTIILAPTRDMATTAAVNWRTSGGILDGMVQYGPADGDQSGKLAETSARTRILFSNELASDKAVHCHSAVIAGLKPGTTYRYRVGSSLRNIWSDFRTFTTAPASPAPFSFIFFGDVQEGFAAYGKLLDGVAARHSDIAFYMIGGDFVNVGGERNQWDELFAATGRHFSLTPLAPVMGNHDFSSVSDTPKVFNRYFTLPGAGVDEVVNAVNYSFTYGKTAFIVVGRENLAAQTDWLEGELRKADAAGCDFKVVACHFPPYDTRAGRNNPAAQKHWVPLFDKYRVDLMLSGHDHSYLRTRPMRGGKPAAPGEFGTTYVVANAGSKQYRAEPLPFAARQIADVSTYQLISVGKDAAGRPALHIETRDGDGKLLDEFETGAK